MPRRIKKVPTSIFQLKVALMEVRPEVWRRVLVPADITLALIKIVKRAAWSKGGQQSYRLEACGKPYVCNSGSTGMDCKAALVAPDAQPPTAP